jgi:hypothetical protein
VAFKKLSLLAFLPLSLMVFAWSCSSQRTPTTAASAPQTIYLIPATNTFTPLTLTQTPTHTATSTLTPTITWTPSITLTSTITLSPTRGHPQSPVPTDTPLGSATPTITVTAIPTSAWTLVSSLGQSGNDGIDGDFDFPWGVAVGDGYIAVGDAGYGNVQIFNSSGTYLYSIPENTPAGMAIDSYGELYICNNGSFIVDGYYLSPSGYTYDYTWSAQGQLNFPSGVKIDQYGNLVVASTGTVTNILWNDDSILNQYQGGNFYNDVAIDPSGNIYAAVDNAGAGVVELDSNYNPLNSFYGADWVLPISNGSTSVAVDSAGNLYIQDNQNNRVVYATTQGTYLGEIDFPQYPYYLAMDGGGDLFITGENPLGVQEFFK